jgi:peptidyl-prolyl cis-trans isomerase B (cyclophilin B)
MDVIDAIKAVDTTHRAGHSDVPRDDVIINKASVI